MSNSSSAVYVWKHKGIDGDVIGEIRRFVDSAGNKKDIPHYNPDGQGGFGSGIPDTLKPYPLFGLGSIKDYARPIHVVEGQKCQRALATLGLQSVTSILGAGSAEKSDWSPLMQAKKVYLLPDHDDAGERYVREVYRILRHLNLANSVKIELFRIGQKTND